MRLFPNIQNIDQVFMYKMLMNFIALELLVFIKIIITMSFLQATFNGN